MANGTRGPRGERLATGRKGDKNETAFYYDQWRRTKDIWGWIWYWFLKEIQLLLGNNRE